MDFIMCIVIKFKIMTDAGHIMYYVECNEYFPSNPYEDPTAYSTGTLFDYKTVLGLF